MPVNTNSNARNANRQISAKLQSARRNGRRGGLATAKKYGPEFCECRARAAGLATKTKYGQDFYSHIRTFVKRPKGWPKGKQRTSLDRRHR